MKRSTQLVGDIGIYPRKQRDKRARGGKVRWEKERSFEQALRSLLNRYSQENAADTPDFVLATYLIWCLKAFNRATRMRNKWWNGKQQERVARVIGDRVYGKRSNKKKGRR